MLPKKNRLDTKTVERIWKEGRFVNSPNITFKFIKTKGETKVSFISPKTASKSAVLRNLLRRRGYRAIEPYMSKLTGFTGAFVFGKKSLTQFGAKGPKSKEMMKNLDQELKFIVDKLKNA